MNYSIDGLVIKVNSIHDQIDLGSTAKDPRWATAYKLPSIRKTTILNDIKISLGRTGVAPLCRIRRSRLRWSQN